MRVSGWGDEDNILKTNECSFWRHPSPPAGWASLPAFTLPLSLAIIGMRVPMFMQQTVPFVAELVA